jgi:hypothetical protein
VLSDRLAARAARAQGAAAVTERFRAEGLHQAMYVVPAVSAVLALVLLAGAAAAVRDRRRLVTWMSQAEAASD